MRTQIAVAVIRYGIFLLLLGGLSTQPVIAAPVGAQLIVQAWDPRSPDAQEYLTPYDSNSALSDAVNQVWQETRNYVCGPLAKRMGTGDLLAKGVTLYDIKCGIPDSEVIATQNGGRGLTLAYRVKGVSFAAARINGIDSITQEQMSRRSSLRSPAAAISNGSVSAQQIGQ